MRDCPIEGCDTKIKRTLAMCGAHWSEVPAAEKRAVWRTFRAGAGSGDHLQAPEDAQAAVEGRAPEDLFG
jgi:hypothetical protein